MEADLFTDMDGKNFDILPYIFDETDPDDCG